ncbi:MAG: YdcF family protein [Pseudomonadota bacterium]
MKAWPIRRRLVGLLAAVGLGIALWLGGLIWFAQRIPRPDSALADDPTDAVIVLTGGPLRLKTGLEVLAAGRARKLFVSGVYRGVDAAELLRAARHDPAAVECCIVLGYSADNTAGNAAEARAWMAGEGFSSLRLVTASYHIERSLLEFRRAMPEARIVPHPVFPENFMREQWWQWPGTLSLIVTEYHKYLAALPRPYLAAGAAAPRALAS